MHPFLTYQFQGFIFKFIEDYVLIYDTQYKIEYKLCLEHRPDFPFKFEKIRIDLVKSRTAAGSLD